MLADCIYMVTSQRKEIEQFTKDSEHRDLRQSLTLKSHWHVQQQRSQQHRQHSESASSSVGELTRGTSLQDEDRGE